MENITQSTIICPRCHNIGSLSCNICNKILKFYLVFDSQTYKCRCGGNTQLYLTNQSLDESCFHQQSKYYHECQSCFSKICDCIIIQQQED